MGSYNPSGDDTEKFLQGVLSDSFTLGICIYLLDKLNAGKKRLYYDNSYY